MKVNTIWLSVQPILVYCPLSFIGSSPQKSVLSDTNTKPSTVMSGVGPEQSPNSQISLFQSHLNFIYA